MWLLLAFLAFSGLGSESCTRKASVTKPTMPPAVGGTTPTPPGGDGNKGNKGAPPSITLPKPPTSGSDVGTNAPPARPRTSQYMPYYIGVVLPLHLGHFGWDSVKLSKDVTEHIDYWNGLRIAFDSLEARGFEGNIELVDTSLGLEGIRRMALARPTRFDALLGITADGSEFALYRGGMDSAFTYTAALMEPPKEAHFNAAVKHMAARYPERNAVILHRGQNIERQVAEGYKAAFARAKLTTPREATMAEPTTEKLAELLKEDANNVLIITTPDERFVREAMRMATLAGFTGTIAVYGIPVWDKFKSFSPATMEQIECYITGATLLEENGWAAQRLKHDFYKAYGVQLRNEGCRGFDAAWFTGQMLMSYPTKPSASIVVHPNVGGGMNAPYKFVRATEDWIFRNEGVVVLKYNGDHFRR